MSQSNDPRNFFQTDNAESETARKELKAKNNAGNPVKLQSKILAVIPDPRDTASIFIAESAGTARRLALDVDEKQRTVYTGPNAPLTSLALNTSCTTLFAGCWDKTVWSWDVKSRVRGKRFAGHSDFVKCVACTQIAGSAGNDALDILISGSADAAVVIWNTSTGEKMHVLRGHTRGVLDLIVQPNPPSLAASGSSVTPDSAILWSADSNQAIHRWRISKGSTSIIPFPAATAPREDDVVEPTLIVHETSVNRLRFAFVADEASARDDASSASRLTLLTASSDKTAKILDQAAGPSECWKSTQTLSHPDFVRDIVAIPPSTADGPLENYLIGTACRDEDVRIWDPEDLEAEESIYTYIGHFEEVTGLVVRSIKGEAVLVSVSIDATVRVWPGTRAGIERFILEELQRSKQAEEPGDTQPDGSVGDANGASGGSNVMTEEEERELAELMSDDD